MRKIGMIALLILSAGSVYGKEGIDELVITAKTMVAEQQGKIITFIGNVRMEKGKVFATADRVMEYREKKRLTASGRIHCVDDSSEDTQTEVFADRAEYCGEGDFGVLKGNPRIYRVDKNDGENRLEVKGDVVSVFSKEKKVVIENNAEVNRRDMKATSRRLDYDSGEKKIVMTEGPPRIYVKTEGGNAEYSAEKIILFVDEQRVIMENNVNGFFYAE